MSDTKLRLYNTLTRKKEDFVPIDPQNVRMYVCGPTVYDFAHIGNARPVIVFDVLYRLLKHLYPGGGEASDGSRVTYVRNITDVDDKINARALQRFGKDVAAGKLTLNEAIGKVTEETAKQFHADVAALGCLPPTHEPRATQHIGGMVGMIQHLIDNGCAYLSAGDEGREVLFDVTAMPDYGALSNRRLEDQQAGARIDVKDHKRNPADFVLWKESTADQPGWEGEFLISGDRVHIHGRPGWHIECSVMSKAHLGEVFDIHGGGLDLIFPHHENEIAQSRCAHGTDRMANVWMHNGYLQVEGRKMSKSEGNFVTIHDLLHTEKFGGRAWHAAVVRHAMLTTHYREPIDWSVSALRQSRKELFLYADSLRSLANGSNNVNGEVDQKFIEYLCNDLDTSMAFGRLTQMRRDASSDKKVAADLAASLAWIGLFKLSDIELYDEGYLFDLDIKKPDNINVLVETNRVASANNSPELFKSVEQAMDRHGLRIVEIKPGLISITKRSGVADFHKFEAWINEQKERRLAFIRDKNWAEADRIRDKLLEQGIQLKDSKDPQTGERVTTWEVKR